VHWSGCWFQLWVGGADQTVPYDTNAAVVRAQLAPKSTDFHRVDGAVHLSFLAPCGPSSPPVICQDAPGFDRAAFHRGFNAAVVAFFKEHLAAQ
jgi:predicted dienelactone hydrolase